MRTSPRLANKADAWRIANLSSDARLYGVEPPPLPAPFGKLTALQASQYCNTLARRILRARYEGR